MSTQDVSEHKQTKTRGEYFFAGNCNYKCFFCISDEIGVKKTKGSNLRINEWIELLKQENVEMITLSSFNCEPTIQKDFMFVAQTLLDHGFKLELRTNGEFKHTDEMYALLNKFENIWFSIQSLNSDTLYQIAKVKKVPNFSEIWNKLPNVNCRVSFLVNHYNEFELPTLLEMVSKTQVKVAQVRKFYSEENNDRIDEDTKAFNTAKDYVNTLPKVQNSIYDEHSYANVHISLWDDVLENEAGIKYFPYTELITNVGRIVPMLQEIERGK